jgi:hypothetical protein
VRRLRRNLNALQEEVEELKKQCAEDRETLGVLSRWRIKVQAGVRRSRQGREV